MAASIASAMREVQLARATTLARACESTRLSMRARSIVTAIRVSTSRRAIASMRATGRCEVEIDRINIARKFFCTFFLTSWSKRIMIRLDKSLTSLQGSKTQERMTMAMRFEDAVMQVTEEH